MEKEEMIYEQLLGFFQEQRILNKEILNAAETCAYLGIAKSYLYKLTGKNLIPFARPNGKLIFFKKADLDTWLCRNRVKSLDEINIDSNNFQKTKKNGKSKF